MLNQIRLFCIDERGFKLYEHVVDEPGSLASEISDYFCSILDKVGLDSVLFTIMLEVKTNTLSKSSVVGHYLFSSGRAIPVDVGCARCSREVFH